MDLDLILEPDLTPAQIVELGQLAEGYGFRTLWIQNYARARDAFLSAVPLAMASTRLRTGIVVVSPYELHPLKIANAILTLNEYAHGRSTIVIGAGGEWNGVMGKTYGKRISTAREALTVIQGALSGKTFNYEGQIFKSRGFAAPWRGSEPGPEILGGASGEKMLQVAAELADGIMMSDMALPMLPAHLPHLFNALQRCGRDRAAFRLNNFVAWHVKPDAGDSYREARRELIIRGWLERAWLEPFLAPDEVALVEANKGAYLKAFRDRSGEIAGVPPDITQKLVNGLSCAGDYSSLDRQVQKLRDYAAAGFTEIALRIHDDPADAIRLIGERVLPALR